MLLAVACGGKFYRLPPDKENTEDEVAIKRNCDATAVIIVAISHHHHFNKRACIMIASSS